ncbi:MAG: F0F1 ATP synthase subunit B [Hyphomonas sp.]|jgi:F-type H+-transporting ATPase subunit b
MILRALVPVSAILMLAPAALAADAGYGKDTLLTPFGDLVTHLVFIGILIFFAIIWRVGAFKAVFGSLDNRAEAIRKELEEAANLREQAAEALALAERRQQDADKEAEAIIEQAKADAKAMLEEAKKDLADKIARREAQAAARIARAEAEAADEVRRAAADAATEAARRVMAGQSGAEQFEAAAREIEKALS